MQHVQCRLVGAQNLATKCRHGVLVTDSRAKVLGKPRDDEVRVVRVVMGVVRAEEQHLVDVRDGEEGVELRSSLGLVEWLSREGDMLRDVLTGQLLDQRS